MIQATELPIVRSELVTHLSSQVFGEITTDSAQMTHPLVGDLSFREYGRMTAQMLREAELFFVASDMADLARVAAQSLPSIGLDEYDAPARCGLVFFEGGAGHASHGEPPLNYQISAVAWAEVLGRGVVVERFTERESMLSALVSAGIASPRDASYSRSKMPRYPLMGGGSSWIPYGAQDADENSARFRDLDRLVRSTWLLMQQPVAVVSEAEYKRHDRRRLERQKIDPRPVRVITLRRAKSTAAASEADREFHHQWIVRGHWRQQWYPSRGVHRPVWIAPHIKGPEGAPLLGGEKVHAWIR